jgi:putative AlgH/UPF0301 family transcriptional regulator
MMKSTTPSESSYYQRQVQPKYCRICFEKSQTHSALIAPCQCKGSSLYIHIHCLEIWQQISLQNNLPQKAEICPVCQSTFTYPSRIVRLYRRIVYSVGNSVHYLVTALHVLWISFVIIPLKVIIYTLLVIVTIPYGQLSLVGNTAVAWIGYEFPPQLALIHTYPAPGTNNSSRSSSNHQRLQTRVRRSSSSSLSMASLLTTPLTSPFASNYSTLFEIRSGILLVATRNVPPSSMFYRAVILLLEYHPSIGTRGVIINFDTQRPNEDPTTSPSGSQSFKDIHFPKIEGLKYVIGGPMETEVVTVLHNFSACSSFSEAITLDESFSEKAPIKVFVAENQFAHRTLQKISRYISAEKKKQEQYQSRKWVSHPSFDENEDDNFILSAIRYDRSDICSDPIKPLSVLVKNHDTEPSELDVNKKKKKNNVFFSNPNYRDLSVDTRQSNKLLSEIMTPDAGNSDLASGTCSSRFTFSPSEDNVESISQKSGIRQKYLIRDDYDFEEDMEQDAWTNEQKCHSILYIKGNCLWLANQLEGEIMNGFWHLYPTPELSNILTSPKINENGEFDPAADQHRDLWNQLMSKFE